MADIGKIVASDVISMGVDALAYRLILNLATESDEATKFSWTCPAEIERCRLEGWTVFQNTAAGTALGAATLDDRRMYISLTQKNPGGFNPFMLAALESKFVYGLAGALASGQLFEIQKRELMAAQIDLEGSDVVDCHFPPLDSNATPTADAECHVVISGVMYHKKS